MIIFMPTTARPQQRYDHRLRNLVQRTEDVTIATDLGVPRSTARGWLGRAPKVVVSLDVTDLSASELHQEVLELRRRVKKLTALLRLTLALLRSSGFTLTHARLPVHGELLISSAFWNSPCTPPASRLPNQPRTRRMPSSVPSPCAVRVSSGRARRCRASGQARNSILESERSCGSGLWPKKLETISHIRSRAIELVEREAFRRRGA